MISIPGKLLRTARSAPLSLKIMGVAVGLTLLFAVGMFWQVRTLWTRLGLHDEEADAHNFARHEASEFAPVIQRGDMGLLREMLRRAVESDPHLELAQALDGQGRVLATFSKSVPGDAPAFEVIEPLGNGVPGSVRFVARALHTAQTADWLAAHLALTALGAIAIGVALAWGLTRYFTRPIGELAIAAAAFKEGDYGVRAPVRAGDEIGRLAAAFNEMAGALADKESLRQSLRRQVVTAAEEERRRVARELHDHTGQALASLVAGLAAVEATPDDTRRRQLAHELCAMAAQALEEVHDLSLALRPSVLDDLGLTPALSKLCADVARRCGVRVTCEAVGLGEGERFASEVEVSLYRIVQEALTNAVRHGCARAIDVLLQRQNGRLLAMIEDDGSGFDARNWRQTCLRDGHLGLPGIEERVALLDGRFTVESQPGGATTLRIEIPLGGPRNDRA